jgi:hypothetical protein
VYNSRMVKEINVDDLRARVAFAARECERLRSELDAATSKHRQLKNALEVLDDMGSQPELPRINELKETGSKVSANDLIMAIFEARPIGAQLSVKSILTLLAPHGFSNAKTVSGVLSKLVKATRLENNAWGVYQLPTNNRGKESS